MRAARWLSTHGDAGAVQVSPSMEHLRLSHSDSSDSVGGLSIDGVLSEPEGVQPAAARRTSLLPR